MNARTRAEIMAEQMKGLCPQFTGLLQRVCKAGVAYRDVVDRRIGHNLYPCIHADKATTRCPIIHGKPAPPHGKKLLRSIADLFEGDDLFAGLDPPAERRKG